jgi:hypothetical protein
LGEGLTATFSMEELMPVLNFFTEKFICPPLALFGTFEALKLAPKSKEKTCMTVFTFKF